MTDKKMYDKEGNEHPEDTQVKADTQADSLTAQLAAEKKRSEEYLDNLKRARAEFVNYKRYIEQERNVQSDMARGNAFMLVLPVLDDLERALASVPADIAGHPFVEGLDLIVRKFQAILDNQGVKAIPAAGEPFDSRLHEAVACEDGPEGIILHEARRGYTVGDKVLRTSLVVVGNGNQPCRSDSDMR
ncbi:MAG: co-chaperone protein GrpE [Dehalococcoides mccartyi]|jgi:Molecular chaperone GrpE (heat shock protein)|uniref:Protein GrpE n=2 Tax=Dehalococcoides mccartyi TaxID=61435 RepID=A0A0V8M2H1_9CHLR|nr:nucleotide exchange factor GrpE [Dehalococcoides mccartyi]AAW39350.1 co-chaperone protein GrpE [Dehalococcoides mccartyi 195]AQU03614.1 nucleotide exchange factor GrpE [Dehalococcoides mccartyi]AQU04914.1 nucleotide exchange factor GrpE [Dehalococcoides mccartyi]KSV17957.1 CoA-transferase [Dehalococcoides mccartyi]MBF4481917.1 nucleotide exchange factor GrpE [Dehalococcoides mccartyi]